MLSCLMERISDINLIKDELAGLIIQEDLCSSL